MIDYECRQGVALIRLQGADDNVLNEEWVEQLAQAIDRFQADDGASAALLAAAEGLAFSRGADTAQLGLTYNSDAMRLVVDRMRHGGKPVAAWLHGKVWGGGAELALACDLLLADDSLDFALPEIRQGLPPAAGASQYLPRRIGMAAAWACLALGDSLKLAQAISLGLVDARCDSLQAALAELERRLAAGLVRQVRETAPVLAGLDAARVRSDTLQVPLSMRAALETVADSLQLGAGDFEAGYARELAHYREQETSPQRQGLRSMEAGLGFSRSRWGTLPVEATGAGAVWLLRPMDSVDEVLTPDAASREKPPRWEQDTAGRFEYRCLAGEGALHDAGLLVLAESLPELAPSAAGLDAALPRLRMAATVFADAARKGGLCAVSYGGRPRTIVQLGDLSALSPAVAGGIATALAQSGLVVLHDGPTPGALGPALLCDWYQAIQVDEAQGPAIWREYLQMLAGERTPPDGSWLSMAGWALLNSGARALDQGLAGNPQDVDVALVFGYGLPAHHAPMLTALKFGLGKALAELQDLQSRLGERFRPAQLLVRAAAAG